MQSLFEYSEKVAKALQQKKPVVALESTVISHGLPFPTNISLTQSMIESIEQLGVVAAVIAIEAGKIKIGLDEQGIERLATSPQVKKLNKADIGLCLAQKGCGATTVAATAHLAALAGIKVFATGGIGGVHQGVIEHYDVSNDLLTLSQTPIVVVSSGVKSILDVAKTLEVLETYGVPVVGYNTNHLPLFYCHSQQYPLYHSVSDLQELAAAAIRHWQLQSGGLLLANPIPKKDALDESQIESWIQAALELAKKEHLSGKAVTPFVLKALTQLSNGLTLKANQSLLINNAKVAAQLANCMQ